MQEYQLDFVTYCVGNLADRLNMSASKVFQMLRSTNILNGYMIPCYDVLHTFSKEYIMDVLINLLKKRGALKWQFITHQISSLNHLTFIILVIYPGCTHIPGGVGEEKDFSAIIEQAKKYAQRFLYQGDKAYLNHYNLDENLDNKFNIKEFGDYNEEWLDFVTLCRLGKLSSKYDMITGGIADDKVFNTVDLYFSGNISKEEALKRLKFIHPNHQICILNQELINKHLHFLKSDEIK